MGPCTAVDDGRHRVGGCEMVLVMGHHHGGQVPLDGELSQQAQHGFTSMAVQGAAAVLVLTIRRPQKGTRAPSPSASSDHPLHRAAAPVPDREGDRARGLEHGGPCAPAPHPQGTRTQAAQADGKSRQFALIFFRPCERPPAQAPLRLPSTRMPVAREGVPTVLWHLTWVSVAVTCIVGLHSVSASYPQDAVNRQRSAPLHEFGLLALLLALGLAVAALAVCRHLAGIGLTWATCVLSATALMVAVGGTGVEQALKSEAHPCACQGL